MSSVDNGPDIFELKHMVMSFRVSELQVLLGCAGRNKSGRKHDLLSRALQLLKNDCSSLIQRKVQELYLRRFPRSKPVQPTAFMPNDKRAQMDYEHCKDKKKSSGAMGPVHPDVRFKGIPFYDVISDVLKPSSLFTRPQRESSRREFIFTLSEEQVRVIKESRAKDPVKRYQVQVQLRFCLLETTCDQKDFLPPNLMVQVNHQIAALPSYIPPSKAGVEPKRSNRPIDITMLCRICDYSNNKLEICWITEHGKNYAVCINLVRPLSSETLLQRLKRKGIRNADHSKALIKEKLARDPDSEIATTSLKVSLLCPLGTMRMTLPIRPITCTHMQCFDAMLFLQMNEKKPTWVCPVCDKPAEFADLFIDGLFLEILEATREKEIIFLEDGKWQPVQPKTECLSLCTPSKSSNTIALDLSSSPNSSPSVNGSDPKRKEAIVIDLTGDSDDESERAPSPPKRKDIDREQDEIHSLSSTSPYRSDTASVHRDDAPPPLKHRRTPDFTWDPARDGRTSASKLFNPLSSSPRPSSYGLAEDRAAPARLHTPGFSGSRDNTPPLHSMGSLLNPASLSAYHGYLDYTPSVEFPFAFPILNQTDALRRLNADHSARSSPYLINPSSSSHLFPPSSRSTTSEHISRNYLPYPYNPYSPLQYLQPQDPDVIPID